MTDGNDYVSDAELEALRAERSVMDGEAGYEAQARRLFRENAPMAVQGIVKIAQYGTSDRVRLDAQKYIVDRVLGKVGDDAYGDAKDPLTQFLEGVEAHANANGSEG